MFDFLQLVNNENMKIYRRPRTWIMLAVLLALTLGISILFYSFGSGDQTSMWIPLDINVPVSVLLITIFAVVISAESVAGEFTAGTIKLLLIRPWSRSKILLSKYISLLLFALFFLTILFVWNLLVNLVIFGYDGTVRLGNNMAPLHYTTMVHIYEFISLVVVVTLSFLISTVFRSGGLAIGLSLFLLLGGNMISGVLAFLDYAWVKYLLFVNLSLTQYIQMGEPMINGMSLGFSLSVLAGYYVVFIAITWILFNKRDVAG
ncbi:ABC transporter permease [Paenibacillus tarimensis]